MTEALVRKCNKCGKPFVKEGGCNRMKCPHCGNIQCYLCSQDITDYSHFASDEFGSRCPMNGETTAVLQKQVAEAQEATVQRLLRLQSNLKDEDIRVDGQMRITASREQELARSGLVGEPRDNLPVLTYNPPPPDLLFPNAGWFNLTDLNPDMAEEQTIHPTPTQRAGNNPYGARGCESCIICRRRKGKV